MRFLRGASIGIRTLSLDSKSLALIISTFSLYSKSVALFYLSFLRETLLYDCDWLSYLLAADPFLLSGYNGIGDDLGLFCMILLFLRL